MCVRKRTIKIYIRSKSRHKIVHPTCDTRPFQTSAFFFNPHGDWPSLKFHFLSDRALVEILGVITGTDCRVSRVPSALLTNASTENVETTNTRRNVSNLETEVILSSKTIDWSIHWYRRIFAISAIDSSQAIVKASQGNQRLRSSSSLVLFACSPVGMTYEHGMT